MPALGEHEFYFAEDEVAKWIDDGVMYLVSPLDTANMTEVELSEEQEAFLHWLRPQRSGTSGSMASEPLDPPSKERGPSRCTPRSSPCPS